MNSLLAATSMNLAMIEIGWAVPVWAYGLTIPLLGVFGWVTYYFLRSRGKRS